MSKRGLRQIIFLEISKCSFKQRIPKIKDTCVKYASITFQKQWFTNLNLSCRNFVAANLKNRLFSILSSYLILTVNHVPNKNKNENNKNCIKETRLERSYIYLYCCFFRNLWLSFFKPSKPPNLAIPTTVPQRFWIERAHHAAAAHSGNFLLWMVPVCHWYVICAQQVLTSSIYYL